MEFSDRLKKLRLENNLTQAKLAKDINMSQSAISSYELKKILPTGDVLLLFCRYFKVSADYLLGLVD